MADDPDAGSNPVTTESAPAILVVDDRRENLIALEAVLAPLGARIVTAASGDDALRELLAQPFAVVLLDVQMPGIDGFATAEMMKRHPRTSHTPIIFLTAFDERLDLAAQGYRSGAVDYLAKPFDPWILRSKVQVFLDLHRKSALLEDQTRRLEARVRDLRRSRLELANAQRIAGVGSWELDLGTGRGTASGQFRSIIGLRPDEPFTEEVLCRCIGGDADSCRAALEELRARATIERTLATDDGRVTHIVVMIEPELGADGSVVRLVGTVQDITEQRESAAALARTEAQLRRERELVDLLQRAVAPAALPETPEFDIASCYLAAGPGMVGGDWYDVMALRDGTALFVIGDVAGHGLEAASAMGQIRTALRVIAMTEHRPSAILTAIDAFLSAEPTSIFATMLVVRCDPLTGVCIAASAGHLPPVVYSDDGAVVEWLRTGPPLGSGVAMRSVDSEFTLQPGSTLLLYTDGLVERRDEPLDEGIDRLVDVLSSCERASSLLVKSAVDALCGGGSQNDDVALLAVRRLELAPTLELVVPAEPTRLPQVRKSVERWLDTLDLEPLRASDIVLAVGELATNVCLHAYPTFVDGPLHLSGRVVGRQIEIVVRDEGRWSDGPSASGGRGIPLVQALGFDVVLVSDDGGTTAQLRIDLDRSVDMDVLP
jgi:serine phosphatase RsbU (regulator of sigma subunit)/CheY-like chemotaxis protein/anti-sigma regulatory factor (Ser/Thr protein kinase)